jgi:hypothetical protein
VSEARINSFYSRLRFRLRKLYVEACVVDCEVRGKLAAIPKMTGFGGDLDGDLDGDSDGDPDDDSETPIFFYSNGGTLSLYNCIFPT